VKRTTAGMRQAFCESNFTLARPHTWSDVVGLVPMSRGRVARIEFVDNGCVGHFATLNVRIVHPDNGTIDGKDFRFPDWLDERDDERDDYTGGIYVWANRGQFDWYIAQPTKATLAKLMGAVAEYITMFEVKS